MVLNGKEWTSVSKAAQQLGKTEKEVRELAKEKDAELKKVEGKEYVPTSFVYAESGLRQMGRQVQGTKVRGRPKKVEDEKKDTDKG